MSGSQVYNGMTFRDEKELARYMELEKLSKQGLISDLYRNVKFEICPERYGNKSPATARIYNHYLSRSSSLWVRIALLILCLEPRRGSFAGRADSL